MAMTNARAGRGKTYANVSNADGATRLGLGANAAIDRFADEMAAARFGYANGLKTPRSEAIASPGPAMITLAGDADDNVIDGSGGDDILSGEGGDDTLYGGGGQDLLDGGEGDDVLYAGSGEDELTGGAGDDRLFGGSGTDTAVMSGAWADYTITQTRSGWTITDLRDGSPDGTDALEGVEAIRFTDRTISLVPLVAPVVVELANLGSGGVVLRGEAAGQFTGWDQSSGDFNGDGHRDLIVGARGLGGSGTGGAYVLFGSAAGFTSRDLAGLASPDGFVIRGEANSNFAGWSLSMAGDINRDGCDDIVISAPGVAPAGSFSGMIYVIFGKTTGFADIDLGALNPSDGFTIAGSEASSFGGWDVDAGGDVNGDGFEDLLVTAYAADSNGTNAGTLWVVYGKAGGFAPIDLASPASQYGFAVSGMQAYDNLGYSAAFAGDFNGDGKDDLVIGAVSGNRAYVIYGAAGSALNNINVANLQPSQGFTLFGAANLDRTGGAVASAGDVNGDGYDDLIVGAYLEDSGGSGAGAAYVIFGRAGGVGNINLNSLSGADGFVIQGDAANDTAGRAVSSAGDVNGDGLADLLIGARRNDATGSDAGSAYVVYGKRGGFGRIDLGSLSGTDGFIIRGVTGGDQAGTSVAAAGDINGDGFGDIMVGAPYADPNGSSSGTAYIVYGFAPPGSLVHVGTIGDDVLAGGAGDDVLEGGDGNDRLYGHEGDDALTGGAFDDWLSGGADNDDLAGGSGNDRLDGGADADAMAGGSGNDIYLVDHGGDVVVEQAGGGTDRVYTNVSYALAAGASVETLSTDFNAGTDAIDLAGNEQANLILGNAGANMLTGGAGNDVLDGKEGDDTLYGGADNDTLYGRDGSDTLSGGTGSNYLAGGIGDDHYVVDGTDAILELVGEGNDRVSANVSYTLTGGASVETLATTDDAGTASINLTGNRLANTIIGNAGNNVLNGAGGADVLDGKEGNDTLYGGVGDDTLHGREGNDLLSGGTGTNALAGGIGDDRYIVDSGTDIVTELAGEGADRVFASQSYTLTAGASVETLSTANNAGTAAIDLTGNELANTLYGNDGANVLDGGAGSDFLDGKGGADTFAFTTALGAGNVDRIFGFVTGVDRIALDDAIFTQLGAPGALDANAFAIGTAATDADDRIVYNSATGQLFYDADGNGAGAQVQFATLAGLLPLTASDFLVI